MNKKSKQIKILFLDILTDDQDLRKEINHRIYGGSTYAEEMRKALGFKIGQLSTVDGSRAKLPKPSSYSAIIMGGSVEDPVEGKEKPWMKRVYKFIREAYKSKVPILGICGGLQFTIRALGGEIIYNSKGRNFGNSEMVISKEGKKDLLFKDLPDKIFVQSSHRCIAKELKSVWKLLGSSEKSPLDAIAIGEKIRLVQFHPEMRVANAKALARMRKKSLIDEGLVSEKEFPNLIRSFKDTKKNGRKILSNFVKYFVQK